MAKLLSAFFGSLLKMIYRRRAVLGLGLVLLWTASSLFIAFDQRPRVKMEAGGATDSSAYRVQEVMQDHFNFRSANALGLVLEAGAKADTELMTLLENLPHMQEVRPIEGFEPHRNQVFLLQLELDLPVFETESLIPKFREQLQVWGDKRGVDLWLTGLPAFFYDMAEASHKDTAQAEQWGLLFALVILIFCYGSLTAAFLPLLVAVTTLLLTQTIVRLFGIGGNETALILNSMVGLGLTIDYCLFMVSRYREERQKHPPELALQILMRTTGRTIFYSALVMLAALMVLLIPDVNALRGTIGNLILVVALSAFNALTVLPLLLILLDSWLDKPRWLTRKILSWHREDRWRGIATHVTARPVRYFVAALLLLLSLAWPVLYIRIWEPLQTLAPPGSDALRAYNEMTEDGWGGEMMPVQIVFYAPQGQSVLDPPVLEAVHALSQALEQRPEITRVQSLTPADKPLAEYQSLYNQLRLLGPLMPAIPGVAMSPEGEVTVMNAFPGKVMDIDAIYGTLDWLESYRLQHPEYRFEVGGSIARARSLSNEIYDQWVLLLLMIMGSIFVILSFYLRSFILPLKASIMNFLPILAAYGLLVWAFQWGGIEKHSGIISLVPITLFCIVFGLSMDYEVLILSRIDEAWRETGEVRSAVINGMSRSGGIITGAALILLGVFSPGLTSSSLIVRELSLGIVLTIVIDATIVRLVLVPSFMMLMGRWNWWNPLHEQSASAGTDHTKTESEL